MNFELPLNYHGILPTISQSTAIGDDDYSTHWSIIKSQFTRLAKPHYHKDDGFQNL